MSAETRKFDDILRRLDHLEAMTQIIYATDVYTPTYLGLTTAGATTYTTQLGTYTRIGNRITVTGRVVWTAATGTGVAIISVPIAASFTNVTRFPVALYTTGVTFANGSLQGTLDPTVASGLAFVILSPATNAAGTLVAVEAAGDISFSVTYEVA